MPDLKRFKGMKEITEDFMERAHQLGKKLERRIAGYKNRHDAFKAMTTFLARDDAAAEKIIAVKEQSRKRKADAKMIEEAETKEKKKQQREKIANLPRLDHDFKTMIQLGVMYYDRPGAACNNGGGGGEEEEEEEEAAAAAAAVYNDGDGD
ncbi:MAG: hypothetical protein GY772_29755 [bacterium]|nr:hypothetical protein [bacterium]